MKKHTIFGLLKEHARHLAEFVILTTFIWIEDYVIHSADRTGLDWFVVAVLKTCSRAAAIVCVLRLFARLLGFRR